MNSEATYRARMRNSARASNDARAIRTRAALMAAAEGIALSGAEALTAANVAQLAGVSRSAFYVHFDNVPDLAQAMMVETIQKLFVEVAPSPDRLEWLDSLRQSTRRVVEHFDRHRALYRAARSMPGSLQGHDGVLNVMTEVATTLLRRHSNVPEEIVLEDAARWMAAGFYGVLDAWISGALQGTNQQLTESLVNMLPEWYRRAPDKS